MRNYLTNFILIFLLSACSQETETLPENGLNRTTAEDTTGTVDSTAFVIQIAALKDSSNAQNLKKVLLQSNLPATVVSAPGLADGVIYRIQVGPYATEAQTREMLPKVRRLGFEDAFLKKSVLTTTVDSTKQIAQEMEKKQLTFEGTSRRPQWSPTGREIAFYKQENGVSGLYAIGTGGGPISKIVESEPHLSVTDRFAWSSSGKQIAFVAEEITRDFEKVETLYIVNKNGRDLHKIASQKSFRFTITDLNWSPDENYIAFNANYGTRDSGVEAFRKALVTTTSGKSEDDMTPQPLSEAITSQIVDWKSENEILILEQSQKRGQGRHGVELRYFDLRQMHSSLATEGRYLGNVHTLKLLPNQKFVVYMSMENFAKGSDDVFCKIAVLHLESGADNVLFEAELRNRNRPEIRLTQDNRIVFLVERQLWICEPSGKRAILELHQQPSDFTVSPRGRKVCLVVAGLLFSQSIEDRPF